MSTTRWVLIYGECGRQAKSGTAIISSKFSRRATSFKTGHRKDSETIQGDGQCDPQISNRQVKKGRTANATRRRISVCIRPSSEQHKRDQWTLWPHKKPHLDYLEWSRCSSLLAYICADTNARGCSEALWFLQLHHEQLTDPAKVSFLTSYGRMRQAFRVILWIISRISIPGLWKILDALSKLDIKYAGR